MSGENHGREFCISTKMFTEIYLVFFMVGEINTTIFFVGTSNIVQKMVGENNWKK